MSRFRTTLFATLVSTIVAGTAFAAPDAPQSERLAYSIMFGGLHVGDAIVSLKETPTGYSTELKMRSGGALKWVRSMSAELRGHGTFVQQSQNGALTMAPQPAVYERMWSSGELAGKLTMTFDPATRAATTQEQTYNPVTGEQVKPEDLPWNRRGRMAEVPANLRTNVFDPMTAFLAARRQIMASKGAPTASFRVPIFDGSRRYDIVGKTGPVRTVAINGVERSLLPVTVKMEPVFGFLPQSEERMKAIEGRIYFTADARMIPVQIIGSGETFSTVMNLAADCNEKTDACTAVEAATQEAAVKN